MSTNDNMTGEQSHEHLHEHLIDVLTADLAPVRRLWSPVYRAALWLSIVAVAALLLVSHFSMAPMELRFGQGADVRYAYLGSVLTAILGAIAVFQLSLPDRSPRWALLPLPGIALWLGASGLGCLRLYAHAVTWHGPLEAPDCFGFIVGLSIPLTLVLIIMLRRAFTLHPGLTSLCAGVTVAAASASLLAIFHPFDAAGTDVVVHAMAILFVIGVNRLLGGRLLNR